MPSSPAERDEYFCGSGALTCRVLYRSGHLVFVQFRTVDWGPAYRGFSNYARVAISRHEPAKARNSIGAHQSQVSEFSKVFVKSAGKLRDF